MLLYIYTPVQMTERSICFLNNRLTNIPNYLPTLSNAQKEKELQLLRLPKTLKIVLLIKSLCCVRANSAF
jgi:hypothetical protein